MIRRTLILLLLLLLGAAPVAAADGPFCRALLQALSSAGEEFASIRGEDTGLGHESTLELPGAKLCLIQSDVTPASWSCVLGHQTKYVIAQQRWNELAKRVQGCLGSEWTRQEVMDGEALRAAELSRAGNGPQVLILATLNVERVRRWRGHRLVLRVTAGPVQESE